MSGSNVSKFAYDPALDGLRAAAVFAVIAGHAGLHQIGGYHGVTVFFVISGYLITSLLLREIHSRGRVHLIHFYWRRAARLAPAMVLAILATWAWLLATRAPWDSYGPGLVGSLTYTTDLIEMFFGNADVGDFQWSWSLGVEEQFYLIWPLALMMIVRVKRVGVILAFLGATVAAVWVLRASLISSGAGHDRLFYSPDSHADALILGTMIAIALFHFPVGRRLKQTALVVGAAASVGLVALLLKSGGLPALNTIDGGAFGQSGLLAASVIVMLATNPDGPISKVLAWKPFVFLGKLSYSLYLWNWLTVLVFVAILGTTPLHSIWAPVWLTALVGISYASWRYVETPLRNKWAPPHAQAPAQRAEALRVG